MSIYDSFSHDFVLVIVFLLSYTFCIQMKNFQQIIKGLIDLTFTIAWISFSMPLLGWLLGSKNDWKTVTFGEFFGEKLWFDLWILSVFYVAVRLLLRGEFWQIVFKHNAYEK